MVLKALHQPDCTVRKLTVDDPYLTMTGRFYAGALGEILPELRSLDEISFAVIGGDNESLRSIVVGIKGNYSVRKVSWPEKETELSIERYDERNKRIHTVLEDGALFGAVPPALVPRLLEVGVLSNRGRSAVFQRLRQLVAARQIRSDGVVK